MFEERKTAGYQHQATEKVDTLLKGDVRATLEQPFEQVGVDGGESCVTIGEDPADNSGEPTQEER